MKYDVISIESGDVICTIEADSDVKAKQKARQIDRKSRVKKLEESSIPGKAEYENYLWWTYQMKNIARDNREARKEDYHLNIMGVGTGDEIPMPECPLNEEEMELAKAYASFLNVKM